MLHLMNGYDCSSRTAARAVGLALLFLSALACNAPNDGPPALAPTAPPTSVAQPTGEASTAPTTQPAEEAATTLPEPTTAPEPTAVPPPDVAYEGISFSYDPSIAADVQGATMPAEDGAGGWEWEIVPQHVVLNFDGYVLPDAFHNPAIIVYPADEFAAMSEIAAGTISDLRNLLQAKPPSPEHIPFLPVWNAAQFLQANVAYIDFQNGTGVRFLTQYGQAANPINNHDLFYTFQGLTHDSRYYVVAILPASNPILPADGSTIPGDDYGAFADDFANYVTDIEMQLSAQAASSFAPDLVLLDEMIQSLKAE